MRGVGQARAGGIVIPYAPACQILMILHPNFNTHRQTRHSQAIAGKASGKREPEA